MAKGSNPLTIEDNKGEPTNFTEFEFRRLGGQPNSEFISFAASGAVVDNSFGTPIPEPSSKALLGLGTLGMLIRRKR